jgi:endonuclease/exonuclease/phosphatase (EEP) superfamily protein YafD
MIEPLAWAVVAMMGLLALTQAFGYSGWPPISILQSLTPIVLFPALPIAVAALVTRRFALAGTAALIVLALVVLVAPVIWHDGRPTIPPGSPELTVAHSNLLYSNEDQSADAIATLLATNADVLVLNEFTLLHRSELVAAGAEQNYPYRVERAEYDPQGIGVWSKYPLSDTTFFPSATRLGLATTVDVDGAPVRLVAVHPPPPLNADSLRGWLDGLQQIEQLADSAGPPTIIVGDFNASRWHPPFRRLLDDGWRDVHEWLGEGFGATWPTDRWFPPAFVRLDHVLLGRGLAPLSVTDLDIAGSDHRGVVVRLALVP